MNRKNTTTTLVNGTSDSRRGARSSTKFDILDLPQKKGSIEERLILESAFQYAMRGWPVFPVHYPTSDGCSCGNPDCKKSDRVGKHPMIKDNLKKASMRKKQIVAWQKQFKLFNLGIVTGKTSNLIVIDIDKRNGGLESLEQLIKDIGGFPKTVTAETGGGGFHYYLSYPPNFKGEIRKKILDEKYPGIDVKADGGYIIGPSSLHKSKKYYRFADGKSPDEVEIAEIPEALLKMLKSKKKNSSKSLIVKDKIVESNRNNTLTSIAGTLRNRGLDETSIYYMILAFNNSKCSPPLTKKEVRSVAKNINKYPPGKKKFQMSKKVAAFVDKLIELSPLGPIDIKLQKNIADIRLDRDIGGEPLHTPMWMIKQDISNEVIRWLRENGKFIQTEEKAYYYFFDGDKKIFNLESEEFEYWLYKLTNLNPTESQFKFLQKAIVTVATTISPMQVYKVAYWDEEKKSLSLSRFDGTAYRIEGKEITEVSNGDYAFFLDDHNWQVYKILDQRKETNYLEEFTTEVIYWDGNKEKLGLALQVWIVSLFLIELVPSRPILAFIGSAGSGKSTTLRLLLRFLFGNHIEVSGVPDKPEDFIAAASALHVFAMDNLDDPIYWMRDKLARASTGAMDHPRRLYKDNEMMTIKYRTNIAITSHTPDTLRRDDLADRLLILPLSRISNNNSDSSISFLTELHLGKYVTAHRNEFWTDLIDLLCRVVQKIRDEGLPTTSRLRMADWESLGRLVAQIKGKEDLWDEFISELWKSQSNLLLEDEPICDAIDIAIANGVITIGKEYVARELYPILQSVYTEEEKNTHGWYKSKRSFSKRLASISSRLEDRYGLQVRKGTNSIDGNRKVYKFVAKDTDGNVINDLLKFKKDKQNRNGAKIRYIKELVG